MLITKQSSTLQVLLATSSFSAVRRSRRSHFWWSMAAITSASVRRILSFFQPVFAFQNCKPAFFRSSRLNQVYTGNYLLGFCSCLFLILLNPGDSQTKSLFQLLKAVQLRFVDMHSVLWFPVHSQSALFCTVLKASCMAMARVQPLEVCYSCLFSLPRFCLQCFCYCKDFQIMNRHYQITNCLLQCFHEFK